MKACAKPRLRPSSGCRNQPNRVESRTKVDSGAALGAVESSMTHISGHDRSQMFLLPEAVDDYVGVDNPVRFIDVFVDELGYLNLVRSSWRLELECHRNIEVIWLLRSQNLLGCGQGVRGGFVPEASPASISCAMMIRRCAMRQPITNHPNRNRSRARASLKY